MTNNPLQDPLFTKNVDEMTDDELRAYIADVRTVIDEQQVRHEKLTARLTELQALKQERQQTSDKKRAEELRAQLLNM